MNKKRTTQIIVASLILIMLVSACSLGSGQQAQPTQDSVETEIASAMNTRAAANSPTPDYKSTVEALQTGQPAAIDPATSTVPPTATLSFNDAVNTAVAKTAQAEKPTRTALPTNTPEPIVISTTAACSGAVLDKHEDMGTIYNDTTAGDIRMNAVAYSWNGTDPSTKVVSLVPAGVNNDIQRAGAFTGFVEYYTGTFDGATCVANQLADHEGAYRFYAGFGTPPTGWTNNPPTGWTMTVKAWPFASKIEVPGAIWTDGILDNKGTINIVKTGPGEWSEIQWWDGSDSNHARHITLGPNQCVQSDKTLQGKHWIVSGYFDLNLLLARFIQMSDERVILDEIAHPYRTWLIAGAMPEGWTNGLPPNVTTCP